jgi:histidinol-phosphatase (PHP family)
MQARGIAVVVGADAHTPDRVADNYETAFDLLAECGYTEVSYFRQRQRVDVPIKAARESLCSLSSANL